MTSFRPLNNTSLILAVDAFCRSDDMHDLSGVPIGIWDVSGCTDMSGLFKDKATFNGDISNWDVSSVTNMSNMFNGAKAFNQDISNWNVNLVTTMESMFNGAKAFNQDIRRWPIHDSVVLANMFIGAASMIIEYADNAEFNYGDPTRNFFVIPIFKPALKTNLETAINEWINNNSVALSIYGHIRTWDTSNITDMSQLFSNERDDNLDTTNFNDDISDWNTSNVTSMFKMFFGAEEFNQDLLTKYDSDTNKLSWDVSKVTSMNAMFSAEGNQTHNKFNGKINNWNINSLNGDGLHRMFYYCKFFNQDINTKVGIIDEGYTGAPYTAWDISGSDVNTLVFTFRAAEAFNQNLNGWGTSKITGMAAVFYGALEFNNGDTGSGSLNWDMSSAISIDSIFRHARKFNQDIGDWKIHNVTDMDAAFFHAEKFNQDISSWNTSNVTSMRQTFYNARVFNQNINTKDDGVTKSWDVSKVTSMSQMFRRAYDFNNGDVEGGNSKPLDNWNVGTVTDMSYLFGDCYKFNQDISDWDTSNVSNMNSMFLNAHVFDQNIVTDANKWNVSKVIDMSSMFKNAVDFNRDIRGWIIHDGVILTDIFYGASAMHSQYGVWGITPDPYFENWGSRDFFHGGKIEIVVKVPNDTTSVRMTGPWWGWDPVGGPVASDNNDGYWSVTFNPAPMAEMEYLWVVNGTQENLVSIVQNNECDIEIDLERIITNHSTYANRIWSVGDGDINDDIYNKCEGSGPLEYILNENINTLSNLNFIKMHHKDQDNPDVFRPWLRITPKPIDNYSEPITLQFAGNEYTGVESTLIIEQSVNLDVIGVTTPIINLPGTDIQDPDYYNYRSFTFNIPEETEYGSVWKEKEPTVHITGHSGNTPFNIYITEVWDDSEYYGIHDLLIKFTNVAIIGFDTDESAGSITLNTGEYTPDSTYDKLMFEKCLIDFNFINIYDGVDNPSTPGEVMTRAFLIIEPESAEISVKLRFMGRKSSHIDNNIYFNQNLLINYINNYTSNNSAININIPTLDGTYKRVPFNNLSNNKFWMENENSVEITGHLGTSFIIYISDTIDETGTDIGIKITDASLSSSPIIILNEESVITLETGDTYTEDGAMAYDNIDGNMDNIEVSGEVDINTPGDYIITYTVTNIAGNSATKTRTVTVIDTKKPILSNPSLISTPSNNTTQTFTFTSDEAGTITSNLGTPSPTNATIGINTITFSALAENTYSGKTVQVEDDAGNISETLSIPDFVIDTTAPILSSVTPVQTPSNDTTPSFTFNSNEVGTITFNTDYSSSTTDAGVGDNTITFNTLVPGTHNITITVTDATGNASSALTVPQFIIDSPPLPHEMPFCAERVAEIKTDQGIYKIEEIDSSHTINGLKAIHYIKTKQLITFIKYKKTLFNSGPC